jgi:hypothetical protein
MSPMRLAALLAVTATACAAAPLSGGDSSSTDAARADAVSVDVPAPQRAFASTKTELLARSSIPPGAYNLTVFSSDRHGCSRSWQSTHNKATAHLEVGGGSITIAVQMRSDSTMGSHARTDVTRSVYETTAKLSGVFEEVLPGKLKASLAVVSCEGSSCPSAPIEVTCEVKAVDLDPREPAAEGAANRKPDSERGFVCSGLGGFLRSGQIAELPFGQGLGFELSTSEWSEKATVYRALVPTVAMP